jgi:broad specificity phosphatase PhoE
MKDLFFLRHFQTEANKAGIVSGQMDAKTTNSDLVVPECFLSAIQNSIIISSPSSRCVYTAKKIIEKTNNTNHLATDALLKERDMGSFEGRKRKVLIKKYENLFYKGVFIFENTPPGGESFQDFSKRTDDFLEKLYIRLSDHSVVICSHNQTLKLVYAKLKKVNLNDYWYSNSFMPGVVIKY